MKERYGALYVVATPIGNLGDMSARAIEVLGQVDVIAAEDTRHSGKLLQHFNIRTPMISLHEFNEERRVKLILGRLERGERIALISDAGTPLISDPGYRLVAEARKMRVEVVPIPGPCAAIAALSVAGLPSDRFVFEGFLPAKSAQRRMRLEELESEQRTLIFYEAPHRVVKLIDDTHKIFGGNRRVVIARELTKLFECIFSGTLSAAQAWLTTKPGKQRGEFVVLVHGAESTRSDISPDALRVLALLSKELPPSRAVSLAAKITGVSRNLLYRHRQRRT
jgi:16S rRNA (cytidine1402-2'-O)-methyltransferase